MKRLLFVVLSSFSFLSSVINAHDPVMVQALIEQHLNNGDSQQVPLLLKKVNIDHDDEHERQLIGTTSSSTLKTISISLPRGVRGGKNKFSRGRQKRTKKKGKRTKNVKIFFPFPKPIISPPPPPPPPAEEEEEEEPCDVSLSDFAQWQAETGYWVGEYSFYGRDGRPNVSRFWNYPFDAYRGFITGNINDISYRQRNVFLYPPQSMSICTTTRPEVHGTAGICGLNGNSRVFMADQTASSCPRDGTLEGPFRDTFDTVTQLVGQDDNALLYQVFLGDALFQSQLTTLTIDSDTGEQRRTRTAQGFFNGLPSSTSFFRERRVSREEFYNLLNETLILYNITVADTCTWIDPPSSFGVPVPTNYTPGIVGCMEHLEQSFQL